MTIENEIQVTLLMVSQFSSSIHLTISNWKKKRPKKNINAKHFIYIYWVKTLSRNWTHVSATIRVGTGCRTVKNQLLPQSACKRLIMLNSLDFSCIKSMMKVPSSSEQDFMNCDCTSHFWLLHSAECCWFSSTCSVIYSSRDFCSLCSAKNSEYCASQ